MVHIADAAFIPQTGEVYYTHFQVFVNAFSAGTPKNLLRRGLYAFCLLWPFSAFPCYSQFGHTLFTSRATNGHFHSS